MSAVVVGEMISSVRFNIRSILHRRRSCGLVCTGLVLFMTAAVFVVTDVTESGFSGEQEFIQVNRHRTVRQACPTVSYPALSYNTKYQQRTPGNLEHLIYNDAHEVVYCYVPKVDCSQWKKFMAVLDGELHAVTDPLPVGSIHERKRLKFLSDLQRDEAVARLRTYTSFVFVRHPLTRLVSAFIDKIERLEAKQNPIFIAALKDIVDNIRNRSNNPGHGVDVTFEEFLRYVLQPGASRSNGADNEHWLPMVELCHPCRIDYTVIGRHESSQSDAELVLTKTNTRHIVSFPENPNIHSTAQKAIKMFHNLSDQIVRQVFRHYMDDFIVFGYEPSILLDNDVYIRDLRLERLFLEVRFPALAVNDTY